MRLNSLITYLQTECPIFSNRIEYARSLTALTDDEVINDLPLLFIYPAKEKAGGNSLDGSRSARSQLNINTFGALVIANSFTELEDARDELKAALAKHPDDIYFQTGEVMEVSKRVIWWADQFTFNTYIRST